MGYKYTGDALLGVSLTVNTPKPLDSRSVVDNLSQLYSIPENTAYQGMTVANVANGNIYMLVDKAKIHEKAGWKASYESIQIIACTEDDYKLWEENTNENYTPKDETKTFLHADTYYYIYEDSINQDETEYYLKSSWGKAVDASLNTKASVEDLEYLTARVQRDEDNLKNNYLTALQIIETYATKELLNSVITETISDYYTKDESREIFVTKDDLRGEVSEGEDDFIFVTQAKYQEFQNQIQEELDKTLKTDGNGQLESITVNTIKSPIEEGKEQLSVQVKSDGLFVGDEILAKRSEIPVIVTLSEAEYNTLQENSELDDETYYYIYDNSDPNLTYVTKKYIEDEYDRRTVYQDYVSSNYYNKLQIDNKLDTKVSKEDIKEYYTSQQVDDKFSTKEHSEETYATKQGLTDLTKTIEDNYVTKEMLKGNDSTDTDYMFVTQTEYSKDKENNSIEFNTNSLISNTASISQLNIQKLEEIEVKQINPETEEEIITTEIQVVSNSIFTSEDDNVLINGNTIALSKDVPVFITLEQSEYEDLIKSDNVEENTYYCTYSDNEKDGVVTTKVLANYYTKIQIEDMIQAAITEALQPLKARIVELEQMTSVLDLGTLDKMVLR